jgi:hypothetical protein
MRHRRMRSLRIFPPRQRPSFGKKLLWHGGILPFMPANELRSDFQNMLKHVDIPRFGFLTFLFVVMAASLAGCQAGSTSTVLPASSPTFAASPTHTETPTNTATPALTDTPAPTQTPAPPPGVFWVDPGQDLGEISKFVLGSNHGPWSDLGLNNIEPAKTSGLTFLRWPGGAWGDQNDLQTYLVDNFISQARMMGAEPSITVRLPNNTPEKAAALVQYVNLEKKYGVKYWSIGNEPSLYENDSALRSLGFNAVTSAQRWREIALAMKAIDPTIKLFGPDIHQFKGDPAFDPKDSQGRNYLEEFLKHNGDLVDIVTVHRYPFPSCLTCANPTPAELFANTPEWDNIVTNLRRITQEITGKELPVGVMEFNSYYSRALGGETTPDSFYNAIWLADVLGRMIRQQPEMLAYWVLKDGNSGHGMMTSYDIRPSYYVYQIYKHFGNHLLRANSVDPMVSVFAAKKDDGSLTVIFVNRGEAAVKKPLQLEAGDALKLDQVILFDQDHKAEVISTPNFKNGDPVELPARSVTLYTFRP